MGTHLLEGLRTLDLTDEKGVLCGKMLAALGVEVLKIEPPGGDLMRRKGPFYHDIPDPNHSLFWFAYNTDKKSITLNLETADGREIFRRLVKGADFVIESFKPGYLKGLQLAYSDLSTINPSLIMVSITPFGQEGPYSSYEAGDLTVMAFGGYMYLNGDPERPPVRFSFPQAYLHAGAEGAAGAMIAYHYRERTGKGQHVDVSAQECVVRCIIGAHQLWELAGFKASRQGEGRVTQNARIQMTWPCRDGYVGFFLSGGPVGVKSMRALHEWMESEGMGDSYIGQTDWEAYDWSTASQAEIEQAQEPIRKFFLRHTKADIYSEAIKRRILLFPMSTAREIRENEQLTARGFWELIRYEDLGVSIAHPGSFVRSNEVITGSHHSAPSIGEHNREMYEGELGLSREEVMTLKQCGAI